MPTATGCMDTGAVKPGWRTMKAGKQPMMLTMLVMYNWVVMCGTNAGSQLKLVNGANKGTASSGQGGVKLAVNSGRFAPTENSDFVISEVMVWDRGLTSDEMYGVSYYLLDKLGWNPMYASKVRIQHNSVGQINIMEVEVYTGGHPSYGGTNVALQGIVTLSSTLVFGYGYVLDASGAIDGQTTVMNVFAHSLEEDGTYSLKVLLSDGGIFPHLKLTESSNRCLS